MANLDRINGLGKRSDGFVWMMEGSGAPGTGNTENNIGDDPQFVANLTVWQTADDLRNFVWNTVHRQFYARRAEWFSLMSEKHFVMWWIPAGHRPDMQEAQERLDYLRAHGDSDQAFGWGHLTDVADWQKRQCRPVLAE